MRLESMSVEDFNNLPHRKWDEDIGEFDSMVILPAPDPGLFDMVKYKLRKALHRRFPNQIQGPEIYDIPGLHDSGYRQMDFVACVKNEPLCRLAGGSDVLHLDGIGGFGNDWLTRLGGLPKQVPPVGWCIDCLPTSGLLRLFCGKKLTCDPALSSFSVYVSDPQRAANKEA